MRIAVASNGLDVSPYFESCTNYNYFMLENGKMVDYRNLPILPQLSYSPVDVLTELEIDTIIVGCLKKSSRAVLENNGITVFCGAKGNAKQTVENLMDETFISCDASCDEYQRLLKHEMKSGSSVSAG